MCQEYCCMFPTLPANLWGTYFIIILCFRKEHWGLEKKKHAEAHAASEQNDGGGGEPRSSESEPASY